MEKERKRTQPGTPEARHTGSRTQQHPAAAPPYSQEARKKGREPERETASATLTKQ